MMLFRVILIVALAVLPYSMPTSSYAFAAGLLQFDQTTIIKIKLEKAQACIDKGDYTTAKNLINEVLKIDKNNAKAKQMLAICESGGKIPLKASKTSLSFSASGGSETITISGSSDWSISVQTASWGHLTRSGNSLTLKVDANTSSSSRSDYFRLKSGSDEVTISVSQGASSSSHASPYLTLSETELSFSSSGGKKTITVNTNRDWSIKTSTYSWGHLTRSGNTLTLTVDANSESSKRTDYFVITAGGIDRRVDITQSGRTTSSSFSVSGSSRGYIDNAIALTHLSTAIKSWGECRLGALTDGGAGVVVYGSNGYSYTGINSYLSSKIKEINNDHQTIKSITITKNSYYCILYGRNGWYGYVPDNMKTTLNQFNNDNEDIYCVSIADNGDYVIVTDKHIYASNTSDNANLNKAMEAYGHIKYACVTNLAICVVCEKGVFYSNIPSNLETKLKSLSFTPDKIEFTDSGTYLITNENGTYSYNM